MTKNVKEEIKVVDSNNKLTVDDKIMIKELEEKLVSMKKDKEAKCKAAKEQLVEMLEVTVDKYRTATGTAEALRVLRFTTEGFPGDFNEIALANKIAKKMAFIASEMVKKAKKLSYANMDQLCDDFYEKEFESNSYEELAVEMMKIDLCRNVGGAAEDMVGFIKRSQEEIDAVGEKLKELKAGK